MGVDIAVVGADRLRDYARVPMRLLATRRLVLPPTDTLADAPLTTPYDKDYDALDGGPAGWSARFDLSGWVFLLATVADTPVAAATLVADSPGIHMLGGDPHAAALWDLRVAPAFQRRGIASALFTAVVAAARTRCKRLLRIETQDTNVPACRFYASRGARIARVDPAAYADDPRVAHETQLIFELPL